MNIVHVHPLCNKLLQMQQVVQDKPMTHKHIGTIDDGGRQRGREREAGRQGGTEGEREGGREGGSVIYLSHTSHTHAHIQTRTRTHTHTHTHTERKARHDRRRHLSATHGLESCQILESTMSTYVYTCICIYICTYIYIDSV